MKIAIVRQQFLSSADFENIIQANGNVRQWRSDDYGMEILEDKEETYGSIGG